jgi:hypothetical protein
MQKLRSTLATAFQLISICENTLTSVESGMLNVEYWMLDVLTAESWMLDAKRALSGRQNGALAQWPCDWR